MSAIASDTSRATAPGKVILSGEHAVVYGKPAIATPVWQAVATATVSPSPTGCGAILRAPDVGLEQALADAADDEPLIQVARLALQRAGVERNPDWLIEVHSELPIAGGLGSGAAVATAIVRAVFTHAGVSIPPTEVSDIVFESERHYHGTPSGMDNTVIAWGKPIWFVKGQPPELVAPRTPLHLLIADSGHPSPTRQTVDDVRQAWLADAPRYNHLFDQIAETTILARAAIEAGELATLGALLNANHELLVDLGVSSNALDRLVIAARAAGALGAKLTGGGRGGNVIALVTELSAAAVRAALEDSGARRVIATTVT